MSSRQCKEDKDTHWRGLAQPKTPPWVWSSCSNRGPHTRFEMEPCTRKHPCHSPAGDFATPERFLTLTHFPKALCVAAKGTFPRVSPDWCF